MLTRDVATKPELTNPEEVNSPDALVLEHDVLLRMLASVRSGPSESVRRLHDSKLAETVPNVKF